MFSRNLRFEIVQGMTLSTLESCIRLVAKAEKELDAEQKNFESKMNGIPDSLSSLDDTEHPPETIDEYWDLYESFPNIRRKAEIINAYSVLEYGLKSLCNAYEKSLNGKEIVGKWYLADSLNHLKKEISIDMSDMRHWKEVISIQELRNKLIHDNGTIDLRNENLARYIDENEHLSLDSGNRVVISAGYTERCYQLILDFFIELFVICPKYNRAYKGAVAK
ncbi:TPA: hypothetical protein ACOJP0_004983 [Vibrio harveyi]|uniref:hypothetical protein n=1 Tax=Vibrio harveyi TaxID=669 RepID=UPI00390B2B13